MYGYSLIVTYLMTYFWLLGSMLSINADNMQMVMIRDTGQHLAIYANFVKAYAAANPAATGNVSNAALGLPAWYAPSSAEFNFVSGGLVYVYRAPPDRATGMAMARSVGFNGAGINDSGHLTVPGIGPTTTVIPGNIPNGSLVISQ